MTCESSMKLSDAGREKVLFPSLDGRDEGEGEYYNRFSENFMFQLTGEEYNSLRFQIGILK